jgi:hypothetical protein
MKARMLSITANDGDLIVEVAVSITPRKGYPLEEDEMDRFVQQAGRLIASVLPQLPFSDYGIENTKVKLN